MGALAELERFFERLFERPANRLFRAHLQPVHLQRRIERAMETERTSGVDRSYAPNVFVLHVHPDDMAAFEDVADGVAAELADAALAFARRHRLALLDRPQVELVEDPAVRMGDVRVATGLGGAGRRAHGGGAWARATGVAGADVGERTSAPGAGDHDGGATPGEEAGHRPTDTAVFELPQVHLPGATLLVACPGVSERRLDVVEPSLTIGRSADNSIVLNDGRVSRHHARLRVRRGSLVLTDLGSTNGTRVNGVRIDEVALGEGDRIELGDSVVVVERTPQP
ncbi:MAG TPA: FhaA domain-containing protein [Candidatus Limnocylindrales bacterium]